MEQVVLSCYLTLWSLPHRPNAQSPILVLSPFIISHNISLPTPSPTQLKQLLLKHTAISCSCTSRENYFKEIMKIRCDVCDKEEATVFCSADEAALCDVCDRQIHHANKLASKHKRFSLLHPTFKDSPLCDICHERRGFLFCQEDRAILCRECDLSIHKSNEHTQKHSRFLLPGVKLSAASSLYPTSSACSSNFSEVMTAKTNDARASKSSTKRQRTVSSNEILSSSSPSLMEQTMSSSSYNKIEENNCFSDNGSGSTRSISEYLMETLPGWHVEDLLDFS